MAVEVETLTPDRFLADLRERVDVLRMSGVEIPADLDASVVAVVGGVENPFEHEVFRTMAAHLLDGLDPEMVDGHEGMELLTDRLCALSANLRMALRAAAQRLEQPV